MKPILNIENLTKIYGNVPSQTKALNGVTFQVMPGEFLGIMGSSGSGKSTLLNCIATVIQPTGGSIQVEGVNLQALKGRTLADYRGKKVGYLFQNFELLDNLTGRENILLPTSLHGVSEAESSQRLKQLADYLEITDVLNKFPSKMSGGQRQRVALGRAIVREPKVFLFDEPLSNLDAKLRVQMRTEITKLHQRLQTTFIYVTHDQTEAMTMASRIVVMKDGVVQQVDTPQNLYDFPANEFVAGFIGSPQMNFFDVRLKRENNEVVAYFGDNKIVVPQGKVSKFVDESYVGREVVMGIRPENIHDDEMFLANAADATIDVKVEVTEKMGSETYLYLTTTGKEGNIIARVNPRTTSTAGGEIKVAFDVNHLHFFDKETARTILVSDAVPAPTKTNLTK